MFNQPPLATCFCLNLKHLCKIINVVPQSCSSQVEWSTATCGSWLPWEPEQAEGTPSLQEVLPAREAQGAMRTRARALGRYSDSSQEWEAGPEPGLRTWGAGVCTLITLELRHVSQWRPYIHHIFEDVPQITRQKSGAVFSDLPVGVTGCPHPASGSVSREEEGV